MKSAAKRTAKRTVKSAAKRKGKSAAKRKGKSAAKRTVKRTVKRTAKSAAKRKGKSAVKSVGNALNLLVNNVGYCEATILDENEPNDPCDIHKRENECENETKDTEYWRSYNCKWKK